MSRWKGMLALCAATALSGQAPDFGAAVRPVLAAYCESCHNPKLKTGNLDLTTANPGRDVWAKVAEKLSSGKMPPPGMPAPAAAERAAVLKWIEAAAGPRQSHAGRVTARRLNRTEYNNTVRDLLGIHARPADEFPVDDSGYGFDNIGDVLSVSPALMDKYMAAARRISKLAVYGPALPPKPELLTHLMAKRSYDGGALSGSSYLPYSMRGALYGSFVFPVDAVYEIRFRAMNLRDEEISGEERTRRRRGGTPVDLAEIEKRERAAARPMTLALALDGEVILTGVIEGSMMYGYSRGEFSKRIFVKAGEHSLRASLPELAALDDPRQHLNPDLRRKVFVDYLDVLGPFEPGAAPPESYRRLFVCGHDPGKHGTACGRTIVGDLAFRAFRRPPSAPEVSRLLRLIDLARREGDTFEEGVRLALQAVLVSPQFLFRIENASDGPVTETELASRLSYFLWASAPDPDLLRAAGSGRLRADLDAHIGRMLADPRSASLVDDFAFQWLQLRDLDRKRPSPDRFPAMDDELLDAMKQETRLFLKAILLEDRDLREMLDANFTFLNEPLARFYGIPGVQGEHFRRVSLDTGQRGGLVTQGSILSLSSYPTRTSPVIRGKWILENLLGTPPPPPPADVPELDEAKIGLDAPLREQLEQHRKNPACAACHNQMDPLGFSLENFDAAGAWRTHEGRFALDTSGALPDGVRFEGPAGLKRVLRARSDLFVRNVAEKLLTYALGRGLEPFDAPAVDRIVEASAAGGYRFRSLVREVSRARPFQERSSAP